MTINKSLLILLTSIIGIKPLYAFDVPFPSITIMEYTQDSDMIVFGKNIGSVITTIEPDKTCFTKLVGCSYLKGNGKDTVSYYHKSVSYFYHDFNQNDCRSKGAVILSFLKLVDDTLFTINEIELNSSNKIDILKIVKSYVEYEKIMDLNEKDKMYCSLIFNLIHNNTLREEALHCIWNGTKGKEYNKHRKGIRVDENCFSISQKRQFVAIANKMKIQDDFSLNILEIAYGFDSRRIENKMISFLSIKFDCDTIGLSKTEKEDKEYLNAKRNRLEDDAISFICQKLPDAPYIELLKMIKMNNNCITKNEYKDKLIEIVKNDNK